MTTITIERAFLIKVLDQLDIAQSLLERSQHHAKMAAMYEELRAALAAPATAPAQPAWHDAPTCAGLWHVKTHPRSHPTVIAEVFVSDVNAVPTHCRWYGPIPEDRP